MFLFLNQPAITKQHTSYRKVIFLMFVVFCFFSITSFAQYDTLLHKPYAQKVLGVHAMYKGLIDISDSVKRSQKAQEIKAFAIKNKDRGLELEVDLFLVFWNAFYMHQDRETSLKSLKDLVATSSEENYYFLRARSLRALAEFYWKIEQNYELAFEQYLILDNELQKTKPEAYPEMARDLMQIGEAYYYFQDYGLAAKYFKRAISVPETAFNTMVINTARNNLGLSYQNENKLDSAAFYFREVQKTKFPEAAVWKRIALGNLGANYYLQKQYETAQPFIEYDFNSAVKESDYGCAAGAAILLADIFRIKNDLKVAGRYIDQARKYIDSSGQSDRLRLLYPIMSKWHAALGNKEMSKKYVDSAVLALDKYNAKFSALKILRAQQKVSLQKEKLQLAAFNLEKQKKIAVRNALILLVILLFIVIVLIYFIQRKKQLAKDLKLQAATQELEIAKLKLDQFTERMLEKNRMIEKLESRYPDSDKNDALQLLQQSTILTEEDWNSFQSLFDKAYPGFIFRVKAQLPDLSLGELRYLVLSKLNISTKQMAAMQGVSPNAIQVMRHRLRKKLNLSDNISLDDLVRNM